MRLLYLVNLLAAIIVLIGFVIPAPISPVKATISQEIVLGSFDQTRAVNLSFEFGAYFAQARTLLGNRFPKITLTSFRELTTSSLNGVHILFLSTAEANANTGIALSEAEQNVLLDFVKSGGCAVLLPDNDTYDAGADTANESLVNAFEMDISGTLTGKIVARTINPNQSVITNGPYGSIASFSQNYPGGITNIGPYGISLATNSLGNALIVIPKGKIQQNSGPVIIFSDVNTFIDTADQGFFSENESLFLNTISFCIAEPQIFLPLVTK